MILKVKSILSESYNGGGLYAKGTVLYLENVNFRYKQLIMCRPKEALYIFQAKVNYIATVFMTEK